MTSEPDRVRQMRAKAEELQERAERVGDPAEHRRLIEKARRLREQSEGIRTDYPPRICSCLVLPAGGLRAFPRRLIRATSQIPPCPSPATSRVSAA
ncbi:DUF6381 family protein [Streptomyces sp. NPDC087908]|uniref:DUF6381 family protein n=1 Tax=Streptomyces sp. NPDC087908 TaxID=3365820 RepID=UPI0037F1F8FB